MVLSIHIDQVLFLPTTNWLTNISSNAMFVSAFDDTFVSQFVVGRNAFDDMFVSQFVVGRKF